MSPLAAVALAREQGVRTIVHVSCRDRNRLALRSPGDRRRGARLRGRPLRAGRPRGDAPPVRDLKATELIGRVREWAAPRALEPGAVVNPIANVREWPAPGRARAVHLFAADLDRELRLLEKKVAAGAFVQSQMVFDLDALARFLDRAAGILAGVRFYASVALLRSRRDGRPRRPPARRRRSPSRRRARDRRRPAASPSRAGLAAELGRARAASTRCTCFPLGAERDTPEVAGAFRAARGAGGDPAGRGTSRGSRSHAPGPTPA